jgi:hypothetical protein
MLSIIIKLAMEIILEIPCMDAIETHVSRLAPKLYLTSQFKYVLEVRKSGQSDLICGKYERPHVIRHRTSMFSICHSNRH